MVQANSIHSSEISWSGVLPVGRGTGLGSDHQASTSRFGDGGLNVNVNGFGNGASHVQNQNSAGNIFILGSAVAVKAGVFYSSGVWRRLYVGADRSDGVSVIKNPALGGVSGKFSSLFTFASSTTSTPGTTAKVKRIEFSCELRSPSLRNLKCDG
jgi:hypothetical protein